MCGNSSQTGLITPCEVATQARTARQVPSCEQEGGSRVKLQFAAQNAAGVMRKSAVHYVTHDPPGSFAATPLLRRGGQKLVVNFRDS